MTPEDLKQRRKALKMTQNQLAVALGVNISTLQRWESGEVSPDSRILELAILKLLYGYGCEREYKARLFGTRDDEKIVKALGVEAAALEFVSGTFAPIQEPYHCVITSMDGHIVAEVVVTPEAVNQYDERKFAMRDIEIESGR
jgi:transcriptional regulator with XRE-family HTH domain